MVRIPWFMDTAVWVRVELSVDDRMDIACVLIKKNGRIYKVKEESVFESMKALAKRWAGLPVVVWIGGRGCLTKSLTRSEEGFVAEHIVERLLPNANGSDFAFQLCLSEQSDHYAASIIRQSTLQDILHQFLVEGVVIKRLVLGQPEVLESTEESGLSELQFKKENTAEVPSWIRLLHALEHGAKMTTTKIEATELIKHEGEMKFFRMTRMALILVPVFLLTALIGNLLWYDHLESRYVEAESKIEASRSELDSIALLEGMLQEQARVLGSSNGFSSIPASYYSDRIGKSISGGITLNRLDIFPMMINPESGQVEKLKYDTIVVEGLSNNSNALNAWVSNISKLDWISGVNILDYKQMNTAEDGQFELLITCR